MDIFFNTTGPCHPDKHSMLPTTARRPGINDKTIPLIGL